MLNDAALHCFIGGRPADEAELRTRFERQSRGCSPDGRQAWLNWLVREQASGQAVGTVQATVSRDEHGEVAGLAWVIGTAHQGQGLAREAAGLMAAWLRDSGVARLRADIHPEHAASMGVARSLGLRPTGVIVEGERRWESP